MDRRPAARLHALTDELNVIDERDSGALELGDDGGSGPIPDAVRLASDAVAICGDDQALAELVNRFWRYAPDEELIGLAPTEMVEATRQHRKLAEQRLAGELKLGIGPSDDATATIVKIVTDDM
ncbi:MAG TPA: hypothetical protein VGF84_24035, partial [Micromonosporaceae bacterium]